MGWEQQRRARRGVRCGVNFFYFLLVFGFVVLFLCFILYFLRGSWGGLAATTSRELRRALYSLFGVSFALCGTRSRKPQAASKPRWQLPLRISLIHHHTRSIEWRLRAELSLTTRRPYPHHGAQPRHRRLSDRLIVGRLLGRRSPSRGPEAAPGRRGGCRAAVSRCGAAP